MRGDTLPASRKLPQDHLAMGGGPPPSISHYTRVAVSPCAATGVRGVGLDAGCGCGYRTASFGTGAPGDPRQPTPLATRGGGACRGCDGWDGGLVGCC